MAARARGHAVRCAVRPTPAPWRWSEWLDGQLVGLGAGEFKGVADEAARGVAQQPDALETIYLAGRRELARGEIASALSRFSDAVSRHADAPLLYHGLGLAQAQSGDTRAAISSFERALDHAPSFVEALVDQGTLQRELGKSEEAYDVFNLALAFDPASERTRDALILLLIDEGRLPLAQTWIQQWLGETPVPASAYRHLARLRTHQGRTAEAVAAYEAAMHAAPSDPAPVVNLGLLRLLQLGDASGAETLFREAVDLTPDLMEAQANLGLAMQAQGRFEDALQHYERLIVHSPHAGEYRWNRGLAQLAMGHFGTSWDDYELRKARRGAQHPRWPFPEWDGTQLEARTILIHAEQGLGDEIMFASCLPDVIARARACVVQCDPRLTALYRRSFPHAHVHGAQRDDRSWLSGYTPIQVQCAIGSLPRFFRRNAHDFPAHAGYLQADPALVETWKSRLRDLGPGIKVGIAWRGGTVRTAGPVRSISLAGCLPLLQAARAQFVSLQRGDVRAQVDEMRSRHAVVIHQFAEADDFDQTAALAASLDLIIAVPSTIAHLAGALGKAVWILVAKPCEWRYLWNEERMPWYPSARLIRQERSGEWEPVVERAAALLRIRSDELASGVL